jgi:two-component system chemotaxis sensor kinase CheA
MKHLNQFLGATFSGEGSVSLIINTFGLANMFGLQEHAEKLKLAHQESQSKEISIDQQNSKLSNFLLFNLDLPGTFGIPLEQVYRLEKFSIDRIQKSGEQDVILYREQICPIYHLNNLLNLDSTKTNQTSDDSEINIIVVQVGGHFEGYAVKSIEDLVKSSSTLDESLAQGDYLIGASIIENKTVSIINLNAKKQDNANITEKINSELAA